ncbi:2-dehydro-3-deoxygalactonokinase, partial [Escherichia coli]
HWDAFTHGLTAAQEHHQTGLLSTLFSTRSRLLTSNLTSSSQGDYLSGLLIGHELCGLASSLLRDLPATTPIALIGSANLNSRYSQAFSHVFPD